RIRVRHPARGLQRPPRRRRVRGVRDPRDRADIARRTGGVSDGFVAILTVELHFPEAASLKGKRHFVRSAKDTLRSRFGAAVAEVDHLELWQRTTLTVACVARSARAAAELASGAERWLASADWVL